MMLLLRVATSLDLLAAAGPCHKKLERGCRDVLRFPGAPETPLK